MRKISLRYCGALGGLLGPLLLQSCHDNSTVCEPVLLPDGTTQQSCYEIGDFGKSTLAQTSEEPAGDNCLNGGKRIDSGFDDNDNGILDRTEVDVSAYICDGADGSDGATGPTGPTGLAGANALTSMSPVDPGADCANGGLRVDYGVDTDADGELSEGEIDGVRFVCNGARGATGAAGDDGNEGDVGDDGLDGHSSLVVVNELVDTDECDFGGIEILVGLDDGEGVSFLATPADAVEDNGELEFDEIDGRQVVCNGVEGDTGETGTPSCRWAWAPSPLRSSATS